MTELDHGLTPSHLESIREILAPYYNQITRVSIFGSRATGNYRANSDIDLVLYGDLEEPLVNRLWTLFDESNLPFTVDVEGYDLIENAPLKEHIDRVGRKLFTQQELREYEARLDRAE